jgi:hypothetical protein
LSAALCDLDNYLRLFPDDAAAARLRALLADNQADSSPPP